MGTPAGQAPGQRMRAVVGHALGRPDGYEIEELAIPAVADDGLLVQIHSAGLGHVDALLAAGRYQVKPPVPYIPCTEFSGVVSKAGGKVSGFDVGDRIAASAIGGGLAEFACVPASSALKVPDALSFEQAAIFRTNYATAYHALRDRSALERGETLLVLGASGGVGLAAVQLGKSMGATVIAACSSDEKRKFAVSQGADHAIDYCRSDWRETLKSLTSRGGVDVVFDPVGGEFLDPAFRSLRWGGRYLVVGFAAGEIPSLRVNLALLKGAQLIGVDIRQFRIFSPEQANANDLAITRLAASGNLSPAVGRRFAFLDFRAALSYGLGREGMGKAVVALPQ